MKCGIKINNGKDVINFDAHIERLCGELGGLWCTYFVFKHRNHLMHMGMLNNLTSCIILLQGGNAKLCRHF
jgi:hypothetical protein